MPIRHRRVVVAGLIAAVAVAVPAAALASGSGSPSPQPAPKAASKSAQEPAQSPMATKSAQDGLRAVAASAGISVSRLQAGLIAVKHARGNGASAIAAFAAAAQISDRTAHRILHALSGNSANLTGPAAVAALAGRLGVSHSAARHALQQISALSGQNGVNPASPAFKAIARGVGVPPAQLAAGLGSVKEAMAGN